MKKQLYSKELNAIALSLNVKESKNKFTNNYQNNSLSFAKSQAFAKPQSQSHQTLPSINKTGLLIELQSSFKSKLSIVQKIKQNIFDQSIKKLQQEQKIQSQLKEINKQNMIWINKLNKFIKNIQNRKEKLTIKSSIKQQKELIQKYNKILDEERVLKLAKQHRLSVQKSNWAEIMSRKLKIGHILNQNQKQLLMIARSKSHQLQKMLNQQQNVLHAPNQENAKRIRKIKNIEELKELGKKYLQFATKAEKCKSQKKMLKLQNKNIDYEKEIKQLIKMKVENLSKKLKPLIEGTLPSRRKKLFKNNLISTDSASFLKNKSTAKFSKAKEQSSKKPQQNIEKFVSKRV